MTRPAKKQPIAPGSLDTRELPKARRGGGATRVYHALREEILCLRLRPGTPLDEVGLSKRFQLSRSPIREALIRLESEGLANILPNRSTIVAPFEMEKIPHFLDALDLMQRATTRLAAVRRTDEDINRINAAQDAFQKAVSGRNVLGMIESNYEFHVRVAEAGRNPFFTSWYSRLLDEGKRMLHVHFSYKAEAQSMGANALVDEHKRIISAICLRDPERADILAHEHSTQFRDRFVRYLEQNLTEAMRLGWSDGDGVAIRPRRKVKKGT